MFGGVCSGKRESEVGHLHLPTYSLQGLLTLGLKFGPAKLIHDKLANTASNVLFIYCVNHACSVIIQFWSVIRE
jgi:hypothetical protein